MNFIWMTSSKPLSFKMLAEAFLAFYRWVASINTHTHTKKHWLANKNVSVSPKFEFWVQLINLIWFWFVQTNSMNESKWLYNYTMNILFILCFVSKRFVFSVQLFLFCILDMYLWTLPTTDHWPNCIIQQLSHRKRKAKS